MDKKTTLVNVAGTVFALGISLSSCNSTMLVKDRQSIMETKGIFAEKENSMISNTILDNTSSQNIYIAKTPRKLEKEAYEIFGEMRKATKEEIEGVDNYIKKISRKTGVNFWDLC